MPIKPEEPETRRSCLDYAADDVVTQFRLAHRFDDFNALCLDESEETTQSLLHELSDLVKSMNTQAASEPPVPNPRR